MFREGDWTKSIEMYTEALNITEYADSEDICIPAGLLEKLYANRAAAYLNIVPGLYDQALEDCEKALELNEGNYKALYRKAKSLKELGRQQEAYEAIAKCSLAVPQDPSVTQLTQDLAKILGLKIRKAYVRSKPALNVSEGPSYQDTSCDKLSYGSSSVEEIEIEAGQLGAPAFRAAPAAEELPPNSSVSSVSSCEPPSFESGPFALSVSTPTRNTEPGLLIQSSPNFDSDIIDDDLDDLLDSAGPESPMIFPSASEPLNLLSSASPFLLPSHTGPFVPDGSQQCTVNLPPLYHKPGSDACFNMDFLDNLNLNISDFKKPNFAQRPFAPQVNSSAAPMGMAVGMPEVKEFPAAVEFAKNPLAETHEFRQACSSCFMKHGPDVLDYTFYQTMEHKCRKDILVGRRKHTLTWKLIRPRPTKNLYAGPYYICKEVAAGEPCMYPGHCTFAYCEEEIDVWTLERKGFISRELLFDPFGSNGSIRLSVAKILQEHHGIFMFLCGVCFDHKPRIISKTNKDDPSFCSHPVTKHNFENHKCLVHILKETTVRYTKIRPMSPVYQLDVCRHEVRYGCVREDDCFYAHSLVELKVWMLQQQRGITQEGIVQEAKTFWNATDLPQAATLPNARRRFGPPNLKLMFVCGQCQKNGQVSEADKNRKYCSAKARHPWTKDKRVVLVSSHERKKWTTVRSLPTKKPIPAQFEICMHVTAGKKCVYIGNCTFAHSAEERDLWIYMKENNIADLEQLYERWLQSQKPGWGEEMANSIARVNGKRIHMPTDDAEEVAGNHCWLCGKNCNSEKQWQQHITSEKHKERVFNSEDDQNCWQYRFPTGTFKVCERFLKDTCTEEEQCKLAHGEQELMEWKERREFLLMKLAKAKKDYLIAPNDNDFGKYSFLLKDII